MFLIIYLILDREGIAPAIFAFLCLFFAITENIQHIIYIIVFPHIFQYCSQ